MSVLIRDAARAFPIRASFCPNEVWATTQNAVSLLRCARAVAGESFFKLDGDVVFDADVLDRIGAVEGDIVTAVDRGATLGDEEMKVHVEGDRVVAFGKGLDPLTAAGESIGIERVDASIAGRLFDALGRAERDGRTGLYYEDVYHELIGGGAVVRLADVTGLRWIEIDTPDDLARARAAF